MGHAIGHTKAGADWDGNERANPARTLKGRVLMNFDEFCGIVVVATLVMAVTLFVVLLVKINRPLRHTLRKQPAVEVLRTHPSLTRVDSRAELPGTFYPRWYARDNGIKPQAGHEHADTC